MEKICIVKRRKPENEGTYSPPVEEERPDRSPLVSIQLTPAQAETMRSNEHFQRLYNAKAAPIYLNLHFNDGPPQRMLKMSEICEILQVSKNTLGKLLRDGAVKSYKIGRLRRFAAEDIMDYLAGSFGLDRLDAIHVDISQTQAGELENSPI
ncbi:MAG TPA: helix-turn-helix domain-containing protein [Syntrophorhabdales bacterium]|nr:helix-turn-helix domain-containing protein [Syntrophorhabdales bacterium]